MITRRKYRISRRLGEGIFGEEGDAVKSRAYPPGQHGHKGYPRSSDYARQLHEKQKVRFMYNISEKSLGNIYKAVLRTSGNTINALVASLESRLDAAIYRGKLAVTIHAAKQMVSHRHVVVNGRVVNVRSYRVKAGDMISIRPSSKDLIPVLSAIDDGSRNVPDYLSVDFEKRTIEVMRLPSGPSDVPFPVKLDFNLILSYYSA